MITIWGNADSINVQKVLWTCEELALAYERIDAGRHFGVVNTPEFRLLNPNGLVPAIADDGYVVWESNTIVRYLAGRYAQDGLLRGLLPSEPRARADAERWMDWTNSTLWPALLPLFRTFMRTPAHARDPAGIEAQRLAALAVMRILNDHLENRDYVGGASFTVGDIAAGCAAWRWFALPIERDALPGLERWFARLAQRPAFRRTVMTPLTT